MSRRRKTGPVEDLMEAAALFPWWVGVALAALLYAVLHLLAEQPLPPQRADVDASDIAMAAMTQGLANAGQYLLPLVCLAAAAVSAWRRHLRRTLPPEGDDTPSPAAALLEGLAWPDFLGLLAEAFRLRGYRVIETGRGAAEGVDLVLHKAGETHLVQCRQWQAPRVGVDTLRGLCALMSARGAAGGWVVSAGRFADEAVHFAAAQQLHLVDGAELKALLERALAARRNRPVPPDMAVSVPAWPPRQP
jgi:restriction system protein